MYQKILTGSRLLLLLERKRIEVEVTAVIHKFSQLPALGSLTSFEMNLLSRSRTTVNSNHHLQFYHSFDIELEPEVRFKTNGSSSTRSK